MKKTLTEFMTSDRSLYFHHTVNTAEKGEFLHYKPEMHKSHELLYLVSGIVEYTIEGIKYLLHPGDVVLIYSNEMHKLKIDLTIDYERYTLHFSNDVIPKNDLIFEDLLNPFVRNRARGHITPRHIVEKYDISNILIEIASCCKNKNKYLPTRIVSCVLKLLVELNLLFDNAQFDEKPISVNVLIRKILAYIEDNITNSISLDEMARVLFVSKYHLCHVFKKHMEMSLNKYINFKKINHAMHLIVKGMSPQEASEQVGYAYYSTFFYNFKQFMGHAPTKKKPKKQLPDKEIKIDD